MYKRSYLISWISILFFILTCLGFAQRAGFGNHPLSSENDITPLKFSHQALVFSTLSPDTNQLMLFIKFSNRSLQFIKFDSIYKAIYELNVSITKNENDIIDSKIRRGELSSNNFENTETSSEVKYEFFQFLLPPGPYQINMELYDLETKTPAQ